MLAFSHGAHTGHPVFTLSGMGKVFKRHCRSITLQSVGLSHVLTGEH